jgi:hypothetical protein
LKFVAFFIEHSHMHVTSILFSFTYSNAHQTLLFWYLVFMVMVLFLLPFFKRQVVDFSPSVMASCMCSVFLPPDGNISPAWPLLPPLFVPSTPHPCRGTELLPSLIQITFSIAHAWNPILSSLDCVFSGNFNCLCMQLTSSNQRDGSCVAASVVCMIRLSFPCMFFDWARAIEWLKFPMEFPMVVFGSVDSFSIRWWQVEWVVDTLAI